MFKRLVIMLIVTGLILGGVYGYKSFGKMMMMKAMAKMAHAPVTVATTKVASQDWQQELKVVGSMVATQGVDVASEVAGLVENCFFKSGDYVEQDTLLLKLRADDEIAALEALQAASHLAELTYKRDYQQLQEKTIAQATFDSAKANLEKAQAQVAEQQAVIAKKYIRAPFSGKLGISLVDHGQYLSPGQSIVNLQAMDPIYFNFYVPQQELSKIKLGQTIHLADNTTAEESTGIIHAINSKLEEENRNIKIQAKFNNPNHTLMPGMYAVGRVKLGADKQYLTLPQSAITYNPYGDIVYVVGADSKVTSRFVTLGPTRGDQVAILKGLKDGEEVVTAGQLKLQNGSLIERNNNIQPLNDSAPNLGDE